MTEITIALCCTGFIVACIFLMSMMILSGRISNAEYEAEARRHE